ncbi:P-loop containing nucleoside triphosphate hydrolase protein [Leptodontidium sp. MPI-SDFR-AT-0119]|nr:P-loop containing nucleoside triphosphate hydrolase protein [Leptodontidium sp. MPI-SDFR-AT-0119]
MERERVMQGNLEACCAVQPLSLFKKQPSNNQPFTNIEVTRALLILAPSLPRSSTLLQVQLLATIIITTDYRIWILSRVPKDTTCSIHHGYLLASPPTASHSIGTFLMSSPSWDYIAKLVCIGDSGTGKSSLTIRLCEGRFSPHHDVTIGVEFGSRIVPVGPPNTPVPAPTPKPSVRDPSLPEISEGLPEPRRAEPKIEQKHMKLSLWDTAGQETYKSVTRSYFRGASGALLVFDISRRPTFTHVTDWLNDLRQIAEPDIVVVLVGNKSDLASGDENKREVTKEEAEEWAKKNGVLEYVETSAKSGEGVEMAFGRVAERIYMNVEAGKYDLNDRRSGVKGPPTRGNNRSGVKLSRDPEKTAGYGCC